MATGRSLSGTTLKRNKISDGLSFHNRSRKEVTTEVQVSLSKADSEKTSDPSKRDHNVIRNTQLGMGVKSANLNPITLNLDKIQGKNNKEKKMKLREECYKNFNDDSVGRKNKTPMKKSDSFRALQMVPSKTDPQAYLASGVKEGFSNQKDVKDTDVERQTVQDGKKTIGKDDRQIAAITQPNRPVQNLEKKECKYLYNSSPCLLRAYYRKFSTFMERLVELYSVGVNIGGTLVLCQIRARIFQRYYNILTIET